ncbi:MAG TPA: hypothetical protein VIJ25_00085 [Methylococcales bacterium]
MQVRNQLLNKFKARTDKALMRCSLADRTQNTDAELSTLFELLRAMIESSKEEKSSHAPVNERANDKLVALAHHHS